MRNLSMKLDRASSTAPLAAAGVLCAWLVAALLAPRCVAAAGPWDGPPPWEAAGLGERQAAAHLLDRFAFGPRPGDVDRVVEIGLRNWLEGQLAGDLPGAPATAALARLGAVSLSQSQIAERFARGSRMAEDAIAAGVITREDYSGRGGKERYRAARKALGRFAEEHGYRPVPELLAQLKAQKIYRARYSESQLVEVLTDFWFNHFNVSIGSDAAVHVLSFERDAIRPHVLGSFRDLLGATARHPAMLLYLSNAKSVAERGATTAFDLEMEADLDRFSPANNPSYRQLLARTLRWRDPHFQPMRVTAPGLNENYARELLELHTLGVDGGYGQRDVIEVARAFTGWTVFPPGREGTRLRTALGHTDIAAELGFVVEGEFLFRADRHDSDEKYVLGVPLPAGRGIADGEDVLDLLARDSATAWHLAHKLAVRFVADHPPAALVVRLARTYELTAGDLREVMRALVRSPELWSAEARRSKVKSPFELAVSALRALDAELAETAAVEEWIRRMGQPLYAYSAPTGYPDRAAAWTGVGAMLGRLNFAFALAQGKVRGVGIDLLDLLGQHQPESREEAAAVLFPLLLPERDAESTLRWIRREGEAEDAAETEEPPPAPAAAPRLTEDALHQLAASAAAILLASPEFQRR